MSKISIPCRIYLLLALLAAIVMWALPYSPLALALLLVMLFDTFQHLPARYSLAASVSAVFLVPMVLSPLLNGLALWPVTNGELIAAIAAAPAIYLMDDSLKRNAPQISSPVTGKPPGRYTTAISRTLLATMLVMLLAALISGNNALLFTDALFALYLLGWLAAVALTIPRLPLGTAAVKKRLIAGTTAEIATCITNKTPVSLRCLIQAADPWAMVRPQHLTLGRGETKLNITVTPPLAGPARPRFQAAAIDTRGLVLINQLLEPVELQVTPRARYAAWLATKYLERPGAGAMAATALPTEAINLPMRGLEYLASRPYQPGDQMKDIDWKHTIKLNQMIVKERIEAGEQAAIIAVNLLVASAEEADRLAFDLITAAMTLAQQRIPAALAAYDDRRVVMITPVTDPREILKRTLSLVKDITPVEFARRSLDQTDINKLKQNIAQLKKVNTEPARRLLAMLSIEYQVIEESARSHPATAALEKVTRHAPVPATIVLISQFNHDAEALLIAAEKLSRRAFTTLTLAGAAVRRPAPIPR
ncbi:MAG: DUF58 domain-containing protein [Chloroflexota bacterium]